MSLEYVAGMTNDQSSNSDEMLNIRVTPNAAENRVEVEINSDGTKQFYVHVTATPEDGKANQAVIKILSKELKRPKSAFTIIRGHKNRDKVFKLES
jgi:uncharacterized protein (TIGR00251 family)